VKPPLQYQDQDFFSWQGRAEDRRQAGHRPVKQRAELPGPAAPPVLQPPPQHGDFINVDEERAARTTVIERIREAIIRKIRGGE